MQYTKQIKECVPLLRNAKKKYYGNLDETKVTDNKQLTLEHYKTFNLRYTSLRR